MTTQSAVLHTEFPTSVRGYAKPAVDEFVAEMGRRLDAMQARLDTLETANQSLTKELAAATERLQDFLGKEAAIASALVAIEQRRVGVDLELENRRATAQAQIEASLEEARRTAESLLAEAREQCGALVAEAQARVAGEEQRLQALRSEYAETVGRIRKALEAQLALLPNTQSLTDDERLTGSALTREVETPREVTEFAA